MRSNDYYDTAAVHDMLRHQGKTGTINIKDKLGSMNEWARDRMTTRANEAKEWIEERVHPDLLKGNRPLGLKPEPDRAHYDNAGNIALTEWDGTRTYVHEMAHWIEDRHHDVRDQSAAWRDNRTQGEDYRLLSDITGNPGYGPTEKAKPDQFVDPYVGKKYTQFERTYATEVLSMGMEEMYADPVAFAKRDPDHFAYTYAAMKGFTLGHTP
jgi:hypothetical protein